jgi:hypothetical protein
MTDSAQARREAAIDSMPESDYEALLALITETSDDPEFAEILAYDSLYS